MSKNKYKPENKIRIAKACIAGELGASEAGASIGADESQLRDWVRQYETEGVAAFLPRSGNRRYDPSLKEAAVKDYLSGKGSIRIST